MSVTPLPQDAVLLHIGPHKTGTTALQFAAHAQRETLAAHGVTYPGKLSHHSRAAMALTGRQWGWEGKGGRMLDEQAWDKLVAETAAAPGRVMISSEFFDDLSTEDIERAVAELDPERVHVVTTVRPLTKILPSTWQQYLKAGSTRPYGTWLTAMLSDPPEPKVTPSFWRRQDHGALVERWVAVVGADRMTVVVVDESNHSLMSSAFEQLLALPADTFASSKSERSNRSMSAAECELIRRTNVIVGDRSNGWTSYERLMRFGAILRMVESRVPAVDEPRIATPHWARSRARDLGAQAAERIAATGVRVIGDLGMLAPDPGPDPGIPDDEALAMPDQVPMEAATEALIGASLAAIRNSAYLDEEYARRRRDALGRAENRGRVTGLDTMPFGEATTKEVAQVLRSRVEAKVRRALRRR